MSTTWCTPGSRNKDLRPLEHTSAVLFDLDGTFADTAPDLAFALNETLQHFGGETLSLDAIRPAVSHGGAALIRLGFGMDPGQPGFEERRQYLLDVYLQNICRHTRLFEGIAPVLDALEINNINWGIVTNKPSWLTDPLMAAMEMNQRTRCIISGDSCSRSKPHPEPILHACELLAVRPENTIYVGDAERDMQAGKAANTTTVCALFGYIQDHDTPQQWPVDFYIEQATDLLDLIGLESGQTQVQ